MPRVSTPSSPTASVQAWTLATAIQLPFLRSQPRPVTSYHCQSELAKPFCGSLLPTRGPYHILHTALQAHCLPCPSSYSSYVPLAPARSDLNLRAATSTMSGMTFSFPSSCKAPTPGSRQLRHLSSAEPWVPGSPGWRRPPPLMPLLPARTCIYCIHTGLPPGHPVQVDSAAHRGPCVSSTVHSTRHPAGAH